MSNFRVKKADGWNKYKVQKRFLLMFWRDVTRCFTSKAQAAMACAMISLLRTGGL